MIDGAGHFPSPDSPPCIRGSEMKKLLVLLSVFVALLVALGAAGLAGTWWFVPLGSPESKVDFEVSEGATFSRVIEELAAKELIRWPLAFKLYVKSQRVDTALKPGTYELHSGMLPKEIVDKLVKGQIKMTSFAIPEGWNMWQIADRLSVTFPHIPEAEWKAAMTDPKFFEGLPKDATTLEGYLFPDTYIIRPKATVSEVIRALRKTFDQALTEALVQAGEARGLSRHQIVTLASIIEKETGRGEERPRISAVFHNRLKKGMKLQTDPTVIDGIWERYDGNIRKKDLQTPTPYNTYVISGLPPGPIANPGKAALEAAVNPMASSDLYFVGKGDGSHQFSIRLEDHNKAVYEYQVKPFRERKIR